MAERKILEIFSDYDMWPLRHGSLLVLVVCLWTVNGFWSAAAGAESENRKCSAVVEPGPAFGQPAALSDPAANASMPAMAVRDGRVLIAWQETIDGTHRVLYALASDGCVGPVHQLRDPTPNPRLPAVAATASGFVLAYEAQDPPSPLVRFVLLDPDGWVVSAPETLSAPGEVASRIRVAANGDDVVFAWTNVQDHFIARRGPVERLPPTAVGSLIMDPGLINFPRVALDADGTLFLAYRDGGPASIDYEVLLLVREVGKSFEDPVNISNTRGLMSDDVALAVEPDGRLRLVWVEQNKERPDFFGVVHSTFDRADGSRAVAGFGTRILQSAKPSVTTGLATAWQTGLRVGALFFAPGPSPPTRILPDFMARALVLVGDPAESLHLAFVDDAKPSRLRYAWRRVDE